MLAVAMAITDILAENGITPEMTAGLSLGEYSALYCAGVLDRQTAAELITFRGQAMQKASEGVESGMTAILGLDRELVQKACDQAQAEGSVCPANFNCPGQITVSGISSQMTDFFADVKAAGGRAIPLKVKGAFHSPFMKAAAESFAEELEKAETKERSITLYSNMTAEVYTDDVVGLLSKQICSPVQWEKIIRNMIADGVDAFIEIGPGKTLTNMIKKIDAEVKAVSVNDYLAEVDVC